KRRIQERKAVVRPFGSEYADDQDSRILNSAEPLLIVALVLYVEENAYDAREVKPIPSDLVRDRLQPLVRRRPFDLDVNLVDDDVRPGAATLLLNRDALTQSTEEITIELVLVADLSVEPFRGTESFDDGLQPLEVLGKMPIGCSASHD